MHPNEIARHQSSASRLVRMVLMVVGKPTLQMMAFHVPEGVLMLLATIGFLRVKVYRNRGLLGLW